MESAMKTSNGDKEQKARTLRVKQPPTPNPESGCEFDMHVWVKPETKNMSKRFTISINGRAVCFDMPLEGALKYIGLELDSDEYL